MLAFDSHQHLKYALLTKARLAKHPNLHFVGQVYQHLLFVITSQ
jgi:hypothetical protein